MQNLRNVSINSAEEIRPERSWTTPVREQVFPWIFLTGKLASRNTARAEASSLQPTGQIQLMEPVDPAHRWWASVAFGKSAAGKDLVVVVRVDVS